MKHNRNRRVRRGDETATALTYALSDVAKVLRRLLIRNWPLHRHLLARRGKRRFQRRVRKLLQRAFSVALLTRSDGASANQRHALVFILAAASIPHNLTLSGLPAEFKRARHRGIRRRFRMPRRCRLALRGSNIGGIAGDHRGNAQPRHSRAWNQLH